MQKILFGLIFIGAYINGAAQRITRRVPALSDSVPVTIPARVHSVDIEIEKIDSGKIVNPLNYQFYKLTVFNNTDSALCILFSFYLDESIKNHVFGLDPVYACGVDTANYYSLDHCTGWDLGNLPLPAKPVVVNPNTYLGTIFCLEIKPDSPDEFHLHYAKTAMSYQQIQQEYIKDRHDWERKFQLKCKIVRLPE